MYVIEDEKLRKQISARGKDNKNDITSMFFEQANEKIAFETVYENIEAKDLPNYKDCHIIYNVGDLKPLLLELYTTTNTIYPSTSKNGHIVSIKYDNHVKLLVDPNISI